MIQFELTHYYTEDCYVKIIGKFDYSRSNEIYDIVKSYKCDEYPSTVIFPILLSKLREMKFRISISYSHRIWTKLGRKIRGPSWASRISYVFDRDGYIKFFGVKENG